MSILKIELSRFRTDHKDLRLSIAGGKFQQVADSYFFAIDLERTHAQIDREKIRSAVMKLLEGWEVLLQRLGQDTQCYLPFDFSDQYIGCLRVSLKKGSAVTVQYGATTEYDGGGFYPSMVLDFELSAPGSFMPLSEEFETSIDDLRTSIKELIY